MQWVCCFRKGLTPTHRFQINGSLRTRFPRSPEQPPGSPPCHPQHPGFRTCLSLRTSLFRVQGRAHNSRSPPFNHSTPSFGRFTHALMSTCATGANDLNAHFSLFLSWGRFPSGKTKLTCFVPWAVGDLALCSIRRITEGAMPPPLEIVYWVKQETITVRSPGAGPQALRAQSKVLLSFCFVSAQKLGFAAATCCVRLQPSLRCARVHSTPEFDLRTISPPILVGRKKVARQPAARLS